MANCSLPVAGEEFVLGLCIPGNDTSIGFDSVLGSCSSIPPGHYVVSPCSPGSLTSPGSDVVIAPCSEPQSGFYVEEVCIAGDVSNSGRDTIILPCTQLINSDTEKFASGCTSGYSGRKGKDAVVNSKCPVGFLLNSTHPRHDCMACPDHKSTIAEGMSTCDTCLPNYYIELANNGSEKECVPCPIGIALLSSFFMHTLP